MHRRATGSSSARGPSARA
uniref:Uncharacterized protein n=1 Tax=Arundo donax TaxID=35708 RepID=A0A0A9GN36_ARUDO